MVWVILGIICYFGVIYLHLLLGKQLCLKKRKKSTIKNIFDELDDIAGIMFVPGFQVFMLIIIFICVLYEKFKDFEL